MSAFKELRDVSNNIENKLRQFSSELFTAKIGERFDYVLAKKNRDMTLFSSKLKLLRAKPLTKQINEHLHDNILEEYGDEAMWKVLEQITVKSLTQAHAVKALITKPDKSLDPELVERKKAIIENLWQCRYKEQTLENYDVQLREREAELAAVRPEWDRTLGQMRDLLHQRTQNESEDRGPLYKTLSKVVNKLELMRWLSGRLVCSRCNYDWLADPHRKLSALALTRSYNTIDMFTQD